MGPTWIPHGSHKDPHGSHKDPQGSHMGPTWFLHASHVGPMWAFSVGVSSVTYKPKVQRFPVEHRTPRALSRHTHTHIARLRLFTRTQGHARRRLHRGRRLRTLNNYISKTNKSLPYKFQKILKKTLNRTIPP